MWGIVKRKAGATTTPKIIPGCFPRGRRRLSGRSPRHGAGIAARAKAPFKVSITERLSFNFLDGFHFYLPYGSLVTPNSVQRDSRVLLSSPHAVTHLGRSFFPWARLLMALLILPSQVQIFYYCVRGRMGSMVLDVIAQRILSSPMLILSDRGPLIYDRFWTFLVGILPSPEILGVGSSPVSCIRSRGAWMILLTSYAV